MKDFYSKELQEILNKMVLLFLDYQNFTKVIYPTRFMK